MKKIKARLAEANPERVEKFEKAAVVYAKKIIENIGDYEFVRSPPFVTDRSHH
jgi:hypothetical protein